MAILEDYRRKPGTKLKSELATPIMVIQLAVGMVRDGGRISGGEETVAIVNLETGRAAFWHGDTEVIEVSE